MASPRSMRSSDWQTTPILPGQYFNEQPLSGFGRVDGLSGNPLHPASPDDDFEAHLAQSFATLKRTYPKVHITRHTVQMPYWHEPRLPSLDDYAFVDTPRSLTTTSITVLLAPRSRDMPAALGYYFDGATLLSLRARLWYAFRGIAGNMGYYMTQALIEDKAWAHNLRFPHFPLPPVRAYLGFHWKPEGGTFQGARPAAVGIRPDNAIDILPRLDIDRYEVHLAGRAINVSAIDAPQTVDSEVVLFTPALRTPEIDALIAETERSAGQSTAWQRFAPMVPLPDAESRVHVFVANRGNGCWPQEQVIAVWRGAAPVPSFGAVLSFKAEVFDALFGQADLVGPNLIGQPARVHPIGNTPFAQYQQMLGGFVPAVVDGEHIYCVDTVAQLMRQLSCYGNANSPLSLSSQESRNADPYVREPAGCLVQTADWIGWVLFDGRHELSIGVSVVDVALLLRKLEAHGLIAGQRIEQAVFVDGGSAMKAYHVESSGAVVEMNILNRVAAGSRNGPGNDTDGLNLYSLLYIALDESFWS